MKWDRIAVLAGMSMLCGLVAVSGCFSAIASLGGSVAMRDSFLNAVMPVCRLCGPECWSQLVFAPMDGSGECYGICIGPETKPDEPTPRIFIVNLDSTYPIYFSIPVKYHHQHLGFVERR